MRMKTLSSMLFLILVVAGTGLSQSSGSWEGRHSFEDPEYDPENEPDPYSTEEPRTHDKITVCGTGEHQKCSCDKAANQTLKCGGEQLESADLFVPKEIGPIAIAHLERNQIGYLFKRKILPGQEKTLLVLDLSQNRIEDIEPGAFDAFTNLLELKLTHNNLDGETLSQDIFTPSLANLNQLYLDYNLIEKLDDGIFDSLKGLTKLVLDGNRKLKISNKVLSPALSKLQVLSMDRCGLDSLDNDLFANLPNLRALSLSGNQLRAIPAAINPSMLPKLQVFVMSDNYIQALERDELYRAMPSLQKLYMRKSRYLEKIGNCAFCKLAKIQSIDFSDSPMLQHFHPNAFGKPAPLELAYLNLKNCNLSTLAEGTLATVYWGTMHTLKLNGNPWNCDCSLKWLATNDRAMRTAAQFEAPTCNSPEALKGMSLDNAQDKIVCGPPDASPSSTGKFVVFLVFMVMGASLIVFGVVYARRRYMLMGGFGADAFQVPRFLGGTGPRVPQQNQMGFAGGNIFADDEDDEEEEEQGVPAQPGAPRPEFV